MVVDRSIVAGILWLAITAAAFPPLTHAVLGGVACREGQPLGATARLAASLETFNRVVSLLEKMSGEPLEPYLLLHLAHGPTYRLLIMCPY
jgi:hypothetical protein